MAGFGNAVHRKEIDVAGEKQRALDGELGVTAVLGSHDANHGAALSYADSFAIDHCEIHIALVHGAGEHAGVAADVL